MPFTWKSSHKITFKNSINHVICTLDLPNLVLQDLWGIALFPKTWSPQHLLHQKLLHLKCSNIITSPANSARILNISHLASWHSWVGQEVGRVWRCQSWGLHIWGWPEGSSTPGSVGLWTPSSLLCPPLKLTTPPEQTWTITLLDSPLWELLNWPAVNGTCSNCIKDDASHWHLILV